MMPKTARKNAHVQPIYVCNICGKDDQGWNIKSIRDELLPLAEKWWEYYIWKQNRIITA